jgi:predicted nucleic acid-binding Zn ribbon protein
MKRAGEFLGKALGGLDGSEAGFAWLSSTWPTIVGATLAAHTQPVRCSGKCLELSADGKAWQQPLESMKSELCNRINVAWGGPLVGKVKFVAPTPARAAPGRFAHSSPARISHEMDNEHIPFIRHRRA